MTDDVSRHLDFLTRVADGQEIGSETPTLDQRINAASALLSWDQMEKARLFGLTGNLDEDSEVVGGAGSKLA